MRNQFKLKNKSMRYKINKLVIVFTICIGIIVIFPTISILSDLMKEVQDNPFNLKTSATQMVMYLMVNPQSNLSLTLRQELVIY